MPAYSALDALMLLATTAGLAFFVIGVPWWLRSRDRKLTRATVEGMLAALGGSIVLQLLIARPRPQSGTLLALPPLPSFPSGHAALVAVLVVVAMAYRRRVGFALLPLAALVAFSRVYVGHHYPSDVVGGVALGIGLGIGVVARARVAPDDLWPERWLLWQQVGLVTTISLAAYTGAFSHGAQRWLGLPGMDKILHFGLFGCLALGTHFALRGRTVTVAHRRLPLAVLIPLVAACLDELVQATSPHRTADGVDLLADVAGLIFFERLGLWITQRRRAACDCDPA